MFCLPITRINVLKDFTKMASNTDDVDDEYLDDPISLMVIDDIKKEICEEDQIIDISSSDEEEICTSAYGKKNFVLPVTFFDSTRNMRLLNKCKPMSINIVDCKQYPTYYIKSEEKKNSKSDESSVEIDNKDKSESENEPKSAGAQNVVIETSITVPEDDSKQEGEKKGCVRRSHCHTFYEKLKRRKEKRKQMALNCKDLSQVDFKRNTGLVGLKITDTLFKNTVNTETTMIRTQKDPAENKSKESNENVTEKQLITEKKDAPTEKFKKTFECVVENALSIIFGNKSKGNEESEKESVVTKSTDYTKDKFKEISENAADKSLVENQCKSNPEKDCESTFSITNITSAKNISKENGESMYMKKVGATLDHLGTTVIPVTDTNTNNVVSNNVTVTENIENKSINTHKNSAAFIDKLGDNHDIAMLCSLKIPSKKIVEKILKLKKVKSRCKGALDISQNTIVQQNRKDTMNKSHTVPKLGIKSYKRNIDGSDVISEKDKLQCKGVDKHVTYSRETKQLEKPVAKDPNRKDQTGSYSPVIPCTTITVRAGPPKSSKKIPSTQDTAQSLKQDTSSTGHTTPPAKSMKHSLPLVNIDKPRSTSNDAKKQSQPPKIAMLNKAAVSSDSKYADTSKQHPVAAQRNVRAASDTKATSVCPQGSTSNIKTLRITEYKPSSYPFVARQIDSKNSVLAPNLTDQNMSKTNLTGETNQVSTPIKSASFSGNVQIKNQPTNGLIRSQTYPIPQISPSPNPKFSGHNAIIFRRPPPPPSRYPQNLAPTNQGQHIQTLINHRPQNQTMPHGSTPIRFCLPPPYPPPPPNYPPPPPNYSSPPSNLAHIRQNQILIPPSRMRGIGMGLHNLRFPGPQYPGCRPPFQTPPMQDNLQMNLRPPISQVNNNSFIGNTANGDPIKKINIPPPPPPQTMNTVNDKQMMLAELNNAIMSPDLPANKPEENPTGDLKRKADPKPIEPVKPKYSKPCPLSKKIDVTDLNKKVPDKPVPKVEYSPPILPIWTYEESFQIYAMKVSNIEKGVRNNDTQNRTPSKTKCRANIMKLGSKNQKRTHTDSGKQDKAKKISFEDYRKRAKDGADRIDVDKIRRHNESKNVTDDYNQDQGYDSDSTVKL